MTLTVSLWTDLTKDRRNVRQVALKNVPVEKEGSLLLIEAKGKLQPTQEPSSIKVIEPCMDN